LQSFHRRDDYRAIIGWATATAAVAAMYAAFYPQIERLDE
jgi:hypothetical protein